MPSPFGVVFSEISKIVGASEIPREMPGDAHSSDFSEIFKEIAPGAHAVSGRIPALANLSANPLADWQAEKADIPLPGLGSAAIPHDGIIVPDDLGDDWTIENDVDVEYGLIDMDVVDAVDAPISDKGNGATISAPQIIDTLDEESVSTESSTDSEPLPYRTADQGHSQLGGQGKPTLPVQDEADNVEFVSRSEVYDADHVDSIAAKMRDDGLVKNDNPSSEDKVVVAPAAQDSVRILANRLNGDDLAVNKQDTDKASLAHSQRDVQSTALADLQKPANTPADTAKSAGDRFGGLISNIASSSGGRSGEGSENMSGMEGRRQLHDQFAHDEKISPAIDGKVGFGSFLRMYSASGEVSSAHTHPSYHGRVDVGFANNAEWREAFSERISFAINSKVNSAEINLSPANMGPVRISIEVSNDQAAVTFNSSNPNVREAIESSLPRLREMLDQNGITLTNADVSGRASGGQRDGRGGQSLERSDADAPSAKSDEKSGDEGAVRRYHIDGLIDDYA